MIKHRFKKYFSFRIMILVSFPSLVILLFRLLNHDYMNGLWWMYLTVIPIGALLGFFVGEDWLEIYDENEKSWNKFLKIG